MTTPGDDVGESPTPAESRSNLAILRGIRYDHIDWPDDSPEDWMLALAPGCEYYFPEGRESCVLTVDGYDPESQAPAVVTVKLARKGGPTIWVGMFNSLDLTGTPTLVWV